MGKYEVKQIDYLLDCELNHLIKESKEDGFRFVERLVNDYQNGTNTFNHFGEGLFGIFNNDGALIGIGGLNIDPFSNDLSIGRIRRFYVRKAYRRNGIGSLLVNTIIEEAKRYYHILVLHTDTEQGDKFYSSLGFSKGNLYPKSSHFMVLKS
jgi:GNAT superfamily N-acetyltransferase